MAVGAICHPAACIRRHVVAETATVVDGQWAQGTWSVKRTHSLLRVLAVAWGKYDEYSYEYVVKRVSSSTRGMVGPVGCKAGEARPVEERRPLGVCKCSTAIHSSDSARLTGRAKGLLLSFHVGHLCGFVTRKKHANPTTTAVTVSE
jgi:hypothetical protein